jgi:hypothetical protein
MSHQILKDVTHLGSKLADMATQQLDDVLSELRGPIGNTPRDMSSDDQANAVNVGRLTANVLQLVTKLGSLVTELGNYDIVRRDAATLVLNTPNPLTALTLESQTEEIYDLFLENNGRLESNLALTAELGSPNGKPQKLEFDPSLERIEAGERRLVRLVIPGLDALAKGAYNMTITLARTGDAVTVLAKKTVVINVLPATGPHTPGGAKPRKAKQPAPAKKAKAKKKAKKKAK